MAGEPGHVCRKGPRCAAEYQGRISGPLLDRMDVQIELPAVRASDLTLPPPKEASADVALRVAAARQRQKDALCRAWAGRSCAPMPRPTAPCSRRSPGPMQPGLKLLREAADAMNLSARGYHRVCVWPAPWPTSTAATTFARIHIAEALSYRQKLASFQAAA